MSICYYYSFNIFCLIIAPLPGGLLAAGAVLLLLEDKKASYLIRNSWHTLVLGIAVALFVTIGFVLVITF